MTSSGFCLHMSLWLFEVADYKKQLNNAKARLTLPIYYQKFKSRRVTDG